MYLVSRGLLTSQSKLCARYTRTYVRTHTCTPATDDLDTCVCFFAEVEDVVHAVLYVLSDKADMVNGITLFVDGGLTAV